jgi:hypothetical protein
MSIRARPSASGSATVDTAEGGGAVSQPDAAGRLLGRLSVLPTLLAAAWLLAGLPLLLAGRFTAVFMLVVSIPLAAIIVPAGLRWTPGCSAATYPAPAQGKARTPWWAVAGVIAVAVAFGVYQMIYHSEFIIVTRDPASYIQFANWIAHHGSLPIPQDQAAFGGTHNVLRFDSFAFYQVGSNVVPQFMAGLPMVLAAGFWVGGIGSAAAMGPILGACAVLTFGGLVARLAGPRWAPLAALVLAISLPEIYTSRSTYSEPLAQILLLGGLCLLVDSLSADAAGARVLAALGGLALGLTVLVRIDGIGDILPVVPYCGLLILGRRRQAVPFLAGLVVGGSYGLLDGVALSLPYVRSIHAALVPLAAVSVLVLLATLIALVVRWDKGVPSLARTWLPSAAAVILVLVVIGFAVRPYVQTVRNTAAAKTPGARALAAFQRADHLPVDPTRQYYELSLHWVFWYIGVPAVILGTIGAALLSRRCLRGQAPAWTLPLAIFAWATVTTLYRPSITPDQPWASRRLVPVVLPAFIVLAVWALGWLSGWLRRKNTRRVVRSGLLAVCIAAMVAPPAVTTLGLRVRNGSLAVGGLAFTRTQAGEIAAVQRLCAAIPRDASVVFINGVGGDESWLAEVVRGTCNVPVASISHANPGNVAPVVHGTYQAGRRPVLMSGFPGWLTPYGGQIRQVMLLHTTADAHTLTAPPLKALPFGIGLWMSEPPG